MDTPNSDSAMATDQNRILLNDLADLLLKNREELARCNTLDVQTSLATNLDNVDRAIATLKSYANSGLIVLPGKKGGLAVYSCYGDPSFGLFGMTLAPALLAGGRNIKILIGWPGLLRHYGSFVEQLLNESGLLPNIEFTFRTDYFFNQTLSDKDISHCVVFGDSWIFNYVEKFKHHKSLTYYGPGNNAAVILPGADLEDAVGKILESAFILSGQAAVCVNRCIIDSRVDRQKLETIFTQKLVQITCGDAQLSFVTPIVVDHLLQQFDQRLSALNKADYRLENYQVTNFDTGKLIGPSLIWLSNTQNEVWSEYHFVPVLPVLFARYHEIADLVSNTNYGIYASLWGDNTSELQSLKTKLENDHMMVLQNKSILDIITTTEGYVGSWGGFKNSGFCLSAQTGWQVQQGAFFLFDVINQAIS